MRAGLLVFSRKGGEIGEEKGFGDGVMVLRCGVFRLDTENKKRHGNEGCSYFDHVRFW